MRNIAILVFDSAWAGSIAMCVEMFNVANAFSVKQLGREQIEATLVGVDDHATISFSGIGIDPSATIDECSGVFDAILIPTVWNIDSGFLERHKKLYPWLNTQYEQGALLFGLLTGAYLMAEAGLLDQRLATTHWKFADDFRRRYPHVKLQAQLMQTEDQGLYCGGGVTATMDLSIQLIHRFCGSTIAQQCERHCLMGSRRDYRRTSHAASENTLRIEPYNDARIKEVQQWIDTHYTEPLSLEEIGARFGFSQRNLTRRFKSATGMTLFQYLQAKRLIVAKAVLRTTSDAIQDVCFNVGYDSMTVFGRQFKAYTGKTPSEYRKSSILEN